MDAMHQPLEPSAQNTCDHYLAELAKINVSALAESDIETLISNEMDRQIRNFTRIVNDAVDKMKHQIAAFNGAANASSPHGSNALSEAFTQHGYDTIAQFAASKKSALEDVPKTFAEKAQQGKAMPSIIAAYKHFCQLKTLDMWRLATEADHQMKAKMPEKFPAFDRLAISVNVGEIEHYIERNAIRADDWQAHNKAATIERTLNDFFGKRIAIVQQFSVDLAKIQTAMDEHIGRIFRNYMKHGVLGESPSVRAFINRIDEAEDNVSFARSDRRRRDEVRNCLRSTDHIDHIHLCFGSAISGITIFTIDTIGINRAISYILFEESTFEKING